MNCRIAVLLQPHLNLIGIPSIAIPSRANSVRSNQSTRFHSISSSARARTMEEEKAPLIGEIEEVGTDSEASQRRVRTKVPEVEIHLYRQGKGPIEVFKTTLGGWDQDQLEVRNILDKYGFKSIYAFNPQSGRGVPIRFNTRNGRSMLTYNDGGVVYIDGEPKDSMIKPVTRVLTGVALITIMIVLVSKDTPEWIKKSKLFGGDFPPWILACAVIVFTRMRKRTKHLLKKFGW